MVSVKILVSSVVVSTAVLFHTCLSGMLEVWDSSPGEDISLQCSGQHSSTVLHLFEWHAQGLGQWSQWRFQSPVWWSAQWYCFALVQVACLRFWTAVPVEIPVSSVVVSTVVLFHAYSRGVLNGLVRLDKVSAHLAVTGLYSG